MPGDPRKRRRPTKEELAERSRAAANRKFEAPLDRKIREKNAAKTPVSTTPPGQASAGGTAQSPAPVVQRGRGRVLIPLAIGAGAIGGAAYLASRSRKRRQDQVVKYWVDPFDGRTVVVGKADRRDVEDMSDRELQRYRNREGWKAAGGLYGGINAAALSPFLMQKTTESEYVPFKPTPTRQIGMGEFKTVTRGPGKAKKAGAIALAGGGLGAAIWGGKKAINSNRAHEEVERRSMGNRRVKKGIEMGYLVPISKAAPIAWPPQRATAVTPRVPSGPHVGHANDLKRFTGKGPRTRRTELLNIGRRGRGVGRKIAKNYDPTFIAYPSTTFGGGLEMTPALSRNGYWEVEKGVGDKARAAAKFGREFKTGFQGGYKQARAAGKQRRMLAGKPTGFREAYTDAKLARTNPYALSVRQSARRGAAGAKGDSYYGW